ncbi:M10 family metallopeptidase C-terminal domain-containing protein [Phormidium tenue FACHB-886]|nr:M10 family metallopeptidase C-terminal domain-containing protein [Phormidium tenue FACHB-886]
MTGYKYADTLIGGRGNDRLIGGEGNDTLIGNSGSDFLIGGKGADKFVFSNLENSEEETADTIEDCEPREDQIILQGLEQKITFAIVSSEAKAEISKALIVYNKTDGALLYNENGKRAGFGEGGIFGMLRPGLNLSSSDFVVEQ